MGKAARRDRRPTSRPTGPTSEPELQGQAGRLNPGNSEPPHAYDPVLRDSAPLWESEMASERSPMRHVYGPTIDAVYERLQALLSAPGGEDLHDLVCVVEAPSRAQSLPAGYPPTQEPDEDEWFQSLLRLWQMPKSRVVGRSKR